MHDAADNPPIIGSLDASYICWQMRLDPSPLLVAQPKQVVRMIPIPSKPNHNDMESGLS
jgi:hypothetical protein